MISYLTHFNIATVKRNSLPRAAYFCTGTMFYMSTMHNITSLRSISSQLAIYQHQRAGLGQEASASRGQPWKANTGALCVPIRPQHGLLLLFHIMLVSAGATMVLSSTMAYL